LDLSWGKSAVDQSVDIQSAELYWRKRIDSVRGLSRNHNLQSAWDDYQKLTSYGEVVLGNIQVLDDFYFQLDDTKGPEEVALGAQRALRPFLDCYGAFSKDKAFPQELSANLSSQKKKIEDLCRAWLKQAQRETFDSEEEQRKFLEVFVDQVFDELDQVRSFAHLLATGFHEESFRKWSLGLKFGEIEHSTSSHSAGYLSGTKIVAETPGARRSDLFLKLLPEPNDLIFRDYITYDENGKLRQPGLSSFVSRAVSAVRDFFWRK